MIDIKPAIWFPTVRTNTGTDNEKAQILGRTGLNHTDAIAVDNLLSL